MGWRGYIRCGGWGYMGCSGLFPCQGVAELRDCVFQFIPFEQKPVRPPPLLLSEHSGDFVGCLEYLQLERVRLSGLGYDLNSQHAGDIFYVSLDCALVANAAHLRKPGYAGIAGSRLVVHVPADREGNHFCMWIKGGIPNQTLEIVSAELEGGAMHGHLRSGIALRRKVL